MVRVSLSIRFMKTSTKWMMSCILIAEVYREAVSIFAGELSLVLWDGGNLEEGGDRDVEVGMFADSANVSVPNFDSFINEVLP